jgi:drug/metabolite transporter (DMT)-like permease
MDSPSRRATLFGFLAIGLWATLAVLTTAAGGIPTFQLLALTFSLAGGMGCIWLLRPGGAGIAALRQPPGAAVLTIAALAGYHSLYFIAFARAPAVEVNLVNYLWPLLIVVFAGLLPGVRVHARQWVGTLLGLAGAVLVVSRGHSLAMQPKYIAGYLAALGAAFTWSAYSVLNRRYGSVSSSAMAGSCLAVGVLGAIIHVAVETWVTPTPGQWAAILGMATGPVGLAFWCWDRGTKHGDIVMLGMASFATPLLSTVLLLMFGRARPHWTQAAALGLLLLGAYISRRRSDPALAQD